MLADYLYRVPPGDQHIPIWARITGSDAAAATQVTASAPNGQQLPFLCLHVGVSAIGGAAQYPTNWLIELWDPDNNIVSVWGGGEWVTTVAAAQKTSYVNLGAGLIIPNRFRIALKTTYNAGANNNSNSFFASGWFVPRGNLSTP